MDTTTERRKAKLGTVAVFLLGGSVLFAPFAPGSYSSENATAVFLPLEDVLATFEFNGDVLDSSGAGRDATLLGGSFEASDFGQGLRVGPGQPSGLEWNTFAGLIEHPYSIEIVLTPDGTSSFRKMFGFHDNDDRGWYYNQEGFRAYPNAVIGGGQLVAGERHYLAFVSTAPSELDVWFQGNLLGSTSASFAAPPPQAVFFRDDTATSRSEQLSGVVEAIRISSTTRTQEEIQDVQLRLGSGAPGAPEDVEAVAGPGAGEITLSWSPPSSDGGAPISGYLVYAAGSPGGPYAEISVANVGSYAHQGLPDGESQFYRVAAVNDGGYAGPWSAEVSAQTFQAPSAPVNLTAESGPGIQEVTLSWQAPEDNGGTDITGYEVFRADILTSEEKIADVAGDESGYVDDSCVLSLCTYRVRALNLAGAGGLSNDSTALGTALPKP